MDSNKVYQMTQMPRFSKQLDEFIRGRDGHDGYFTMMTVRHPFARLYSAWKETFYENYLSFSIFSELGFKLGFRNRFLSQDLNLLYNFQFSIKFIILSKIFNLVYNFQFCLDISILSKNFQFCLNFSILAKNI